MRERIALLVLTAIYMLAVLSTLILANIPVYVGNLLYPGGIFIFPLTFLCAGAITEYYGATVARCLIGVGAVCQLFFALLGMYVIHMPHPMYWMNQKNYDAVFSPTLWFFFSSFTGVVLGELLNVSLFKYLKERLHKYHFALRCFLCSLIGQLTVSIIVDLMAFSKKYPANDLVNMIFSGFGYKSTFMLVSLIPTWILIRYLKSSTS